MLIKQPKQWGVKREYTIKLTINKRDINNKLSYIPLKRISEEKVQIDKSSILITDMEGFPIPIKERTHGVYIEIDPPIFSAVSVLVYFNSLVPKEN